MSEGIIIDKFKLFRNYILSYFYSDNEIVNNDILDALEESKYEIENEQEQEEKEIINDTIRIIIDKNETRIIDNI